MRKILKRFVFFAMHFVARIVRAQYVQNAKAKWKMHEPEASRDHHREAFSFSLLCASINFRCNSKDRGCNYKNQIKNIMEGKCITQKQ